MSCHHHCHDHSGEACSTHAEHKHSCCCHDHHHEKGEFAHELLELADEAWMEILYEKIKSKIEAACGSDLEKIAELVAKSNDARWKRKKEKHLAADDYLDKIYELLNK